MNLPAPRTVPAAIGPLVDLDELIGQKDDRETGLVPRKIPRPPVEEYSEEQASGPLTPREYSTLTKCEAARGNHETATWMLGIALESIKKRRLFRGDGSRTWEQYVDEEWDGLGSTSVARTREANRLIREWRTRAALGQICPRSVPDSHARELVDLADERGHAHVAQGYAAFRSFVEERGKRVTAELLAFWVRNFDQRAMQPVPAAIAALEEHDERQAAEKAQPPKRTPVPPVPGQAGPSNAAVAPPPAPAPSTAPFRVAPAETLGEEMVTVMVPAHRWRQFERIAEGVEAMCGPDEDVTRGLAVVADLVSMNAGVKASWRARM